VFSLTDATMVTAGNNHTCVLRTGGAVACWGQGAAGQLGNGTTTGRAVPGPVGSATALLNDAVHVSAGDLHTCAVRREGAVVCWGVNSNGQLGDGTIAQRLLPTQVNVPPPFVGFLMDGVQVAAGYRHTCVLRRDGTVVCFGANPYGGLGDGSTTQRTLPVVVASLTDAVEIAAGQWFTCARRATGSVSCWGFNGQGQLGDGSTAQRLLPVAVTGVTDATSIVAGTSHVCVRRASGPPSCWGHNAYGAVGNGWTVNHTPPRDLPFGLP
jgi:alpha-tubulin suppressor-like RCC1 family protein